MKPWKNSDIYHFEEEFNYLEIIIKYYLKDFRNIVWAKAEHWIYLPFIFHSQTVTSGD